MGYSEGVFVFIVVWIFSFFNCFFVVENIWGCFLYYEIWDYLKLCYEVELLFYELICLFIGYVILGGNFYWMDFWDCEKFYILFIIIF